MGRVWRDAWNPHPDNYPKRTDAQRRLDEREKTLNIIDWPQLRKWAGTAWGYAVAAALGYGFGDDIIAAIVWLFTEGGTA